MLDQNTDETLDRTEYYAVDHDRAMLLAVSSNVLQFETLRQLEVKLDRTALPGTSDTVYQMEVDLRSVERTVAFVYYIKEAAARPERCAARLLPSPSLRRCPWNPPDGWTALHDTGSRTGE